MYKHKKNIPFGNESAVAEWHRLSLPSRRGGLCHHNVKLKNEQKPIPFGNESAEPSGIDLLFHLAVADSALQWVA